MVWTLGEEGAEGDLTVGEAGGEEGAEETGVSKGAQLLAMALMSPRGGRTPFAFRLWWIEGILEIDSSTIDRDGPVSLVSLSVVFEVTPSDDVLGDVTGTLELELEFFGSDPSSLIVSTAASTFVLPGPGLGPGEEAGLSTLGMGLGPPGVAGLSDFGGTPVRVAV